MMFQAQETHKSSMKQQRVYAIHIIRKKKQLKVKSHTCILGP